MKSYQILFFAAALSACSNNVKTNTSFTESSKSNTEQVEPKKEEVNDDALVSFKVNGVAANTKKGTSKDNDKQGGMFNLAKSNLTIMLLGDDPKMPHRGSLDFSIDNFNPVPGSFNMNENFRTSFSRYGTAGAGNMTTYYASLKGTTADMQLRKSQLQITKVEKIPSSFGEDYLLSGKFSCTLTLAVGFQNPVSTIVISDGNFSKIRISSFGKRP